METRTGEVLLSTQQVEALRKYLQQAMYSLDIAENVAPHVFDYTSNARADLHDALKMLEPGEASAAVAVPTPVPQAPRAGGRCPHAAIRRFFAIAKELGFNTRDKDGARAAVCRYFGIGVCSRSKLTHEQWMEAGTAMKKGWIFWGKVAVAGGAR